jgi:ribosome-associated translation inhibitor RaiA
MVRVLFKNFDRSEALEELAVELLGRVDYNGEKQPEVTVIFEMRNGPFKRGRDEFLVKLVAHWPWGTYEPIEKRDPSPYKAMRLAVNALRSHLNRMLHRKRDPKRWRTQSRKIHESTRRNPPQRDIEFWDQVS